MRLPRLTTRRLMILVAVVAVSIWSTMMVRRVLDYRQRAEDHVVLEQRCRDMENDELQLYQESLIRLNKMTTETRQELEGDVRENREILKQARAAHAPEEVISKMESSLKVAEAGIRENAAYDSERRRGTIARHLVESKTARDWVEYHVGLARKYRRAMWRPWLPVAPDPPEPK